MGTIGIATDSNSGILPHDAEKMGVMILPMPCLCEDGCYYEGVSITREEFFKRLNNGEKITTSQPSPDELMEFWRDGLKKYDQIVYIPISSGLSGSCNTAMLLAQEDEFEDKVIVVDNGRVATPLRRSILDAFELIEEGYSAEQIKDILEKAKDKMSIYIAVETLEFLKRSGRITPTTAAIANVLNIKPVLSLGVGILDTYKKCRGMKKAKKEMLEAIRNDLESTFKEYYDNNELYLLAATSADEQTTKEWVEEIKEAFPGMDVLCDDLSLVVSGHVGEGALGVGCSCKPKR